MILFPHTHLHTNTLPHPPPPLMSSVILDTHKCCVSDRRSTKKGRDTKSFTTHLQAGWVMASREEINSGRGDTIKAVHGPTSRHCRQVLIHKAGVSPEQRGRQEALLLSLSGLWITKADHSGVRGGGTTGNHTEDQSLWEKNGFHVVWLLHNGSNCSIITELTQWNVRSSNRLLF